MTDTPLEQEPFDNLIARLRNACSRSDVSLDRVREIVAYAESDPTAPARRHRRRNEQDQRA